MEEQRLLEQSGIHDCGSTGRRGARNIYNLNFPTTHIYALGYSIIHGKRSPKHISPSYLFSRDTVTKIIEYSYTYTTDKDFRLAQEKKLTFYNRNHKVCGTL